MHTAMCKSFELPLIYLYFSYLCCNFLIIIFFSNSVSGLLMGSQRFSLKSFPLIINSVIVPDSFQKNVFCLFVKLPIGDL